MFHNKASTKYKTDTNTENKGQKAIKYIENKQQETEVSPSISTITLNVSGLNFSVQRHRLAEQIFLKTGSNCILSTRDPLQM